MRTFLIATSAALCLFAASGSRAASIVNGGFEATDIRTGVLYPGDPLDGWEYSYTEFGASGLLSADANDTSFLGQGTPTGYEGSQFAFLLNSGTLKQTVATTGVNSLAISWLDAAQIGSPNRQLYELVVDGVVYGSFSMAANQNFTERRVVVPLLLGDGNHTISFVGRGHPDNTAFIDAVAISAVPEPETWALMATGMGLLGVMARRRARPSTRVMPMGHTLV